MTTPEPVYVKHLPRDVVLELDRLAGLVIENGGSGHVSALMNDGEVVKYDHRAVSTRRVVKPGR